MAPPTTRKAKKSDAVLRFRADGVTYTLDREEIELQHERELFVAAQVTPDQAFAALLGGARFGLAATIFLARRQAGERVTYDAVERQVAAALKASGPDGFDLAVIEDDEPDGAPKA